MTAWRRGLHAVTVGVCIFGIGVGIITETLIGPIFFGTSAGFDGGWRVQFGIGRIFGRPIRL